MLCKSAPTHLPSQMALSNCHMASSLTSPSHTPCSQDGRDYSDDPDAQQNWELQKAVLVWIGNNK